MNIKDVFPTKCGQEIRPFIIKKMLYNMLKSKK